MKTVKKIEISDKLKSAIATGNGCKPDLGIGNKYYLLWDVSGSGNQILEFIEMKAKELVKDFKRDEISVPGIVFGLPLDTFVKVKGHEDFYMVNKKRFKKYIKKAFHKAKV